jgi:hypothetical protein
MQTETEHVAWKKDCTTELYAVGNEKDRSRARFDAKEEFRNEHGDIGFTGAEIVGENEGTGVYHVLVFRH